MALGWMVRLAGRVGVSRACIHALERGTAGWDSRG
jgi:DNA-binding XRE family transcriptional regulator